jgi:diadenosine tetraphosphate (Ap4A) HIT family hydrolase
VAERADLEGAQAVSSIGGSVWDDPPRWQALLDEATCPICAGGGAPRGVLAERSASWITTEPLAPMPGYVCVVAKRHVVEPWQLEGEERAAFWDDLLFAAERVARLVRPVKVNYEIHGNSIPHLHAHVYPRFRGDRFVGGPIDNSVPSVENLPADTLREALA